MAEGSSAHAAGGERRPRRRDKGKGRAQEPQLEVSGSSSLPGPSKQSSSKHASSSHWDCIPIARSEVSSIPPLWSKDGRFYFTAAHTSLFIHSSTGPDFERLSTLSSTHPNGHCKPITSVTLHPTNPLQLLTSSEDGTVKIWDWVEGRLVRTITVIDGAINQMCLSQVADKWWIFVSLTLPKQSKKGEKSDGSFTYRVMRVPLAPPPPAPSDKPVFTDLHAVGKLSAPPAALMVSPRGTYVVALAGQKAYVYRLPTEVHDPRWKPTCVKFVSDERFTCGSFAPDRKSKSEQEEWFASGDEKGVIRLWHGLGAAFRQLDAASGGMLHPDTEKRLPTTSLHWHAHAVASIAFTSAGAQILSVGEESVLVQWHLASGKREYIPRLGGRPILSVAVRGGSRGVEEEFWMGFADGAMMRVGATTGRVSAVGHGVRLDPLRPTSKRPYPIAIHPATKSLVVPSSHPSTLQFIDPLESAVRFDLEVAPSNRVSRRDDKELEPVAVEAVAFSQPRDGRSEWMATVEGRPSDEEEGGGLVKTLKFWRWSGDKYIVNTQYPRPHGVDDVTALAIGAANEGAEPFALTAGRSGSVKLWHVRQAKKSDHGKTSSKKPAAAEYYWATRSTFTYRSMPVHAAAFSPDASLLVLAHGTVVTLWDTANNVLVRALESTMDVRKVIFAGSEGRYIVGAGAAKGLAIWDVLSCSLATVQPTQQVEAIVSLPSGFIVANTTASTTSLVAFSSSGTQVSSATLKTPMSVLTPLPSPGLHMVGIAPSGEIYRFGDLQRSTNPAARAITAPAAKRTTSIWQEMFGKDAFLDDLAPEEPEQAEAAVSALQRRAAGHPEKVFDGPSHTLPPVSMLFEAFMDELLVSRAEGDEDSGDKILVDEEETLEAAPIVLAPTAVRTVGDKDMVELEAFFKDLRTSAPAKTPKTPAPKAKSRPNGVPNGHARAVSTPLKGSGAKVHSPAVSTPGEPEAADGKKKSKKRKAPRHSEI